MRRLVDPRGTTTGTIEVRLKADLQPLPFVEQVIPLTESTLFPVPRRPRTVTLASGLLYLLAGVNLLSAVALVAYSDTIAQSLRDMIERNPEQFKNISDPERFISLGIGVATATYGVFAVLAAVLGLLNASGRNGARIVTWIWAGLGLCFVPVGLGQSATSNNASTLMRSPLAIALLVIVLSIAVLLALPASNVYFRQAKDSRLLRRMMGR